MVKKYNVAVVGATGNVGGYMLSALAERNFPVNQVVALASSASIGKEVSFGEVQTLKVLDIHNYDFKGIDIAFFAADSEVAAKYAPLATKAGAVVIDNSSHYRMDPDVPLIIPEVNPDAISGYKIKNIIANPNCSTIQMLVALKPLHDQVKIKRIVVSTYQSVSGAGKPAMDELYDQTKGMYVFNQQEPQHFPKRIAFNLIPHIDVFLDDGNTKEEWKMQVETDKILGEHIPVSATCVRVPVFVGHSEAINIEFAEEIDEEEVRELLEEAPGVMVVDRREPGGYITPIEVAGDESVYVSRIRRDPTVKHGINMWVVADPITKGAATNAVQIAEMLTEFM